MPGCGFTKSKEIASRGVEKFHQQYDESKFAEIYSGATPAFRSAAKEEDFMKFIQAVHRKLGAYKSGTAEGWQTNVFNGKTSVVLSFKSEFEKGPATERFTFVVSGESAALQGYTINSTSLITD